jgi:hypothetical protein
LQISIIFFTTICKTCSNNTIIDAPPHSLKDSNVNLKMKTMEKEGIGVCSLVHNTLKVERCVKALGWGLGQMMNVLIIHTNQTTSCSVWLEHFWCTNKPRAYTNSQNSPWPRLEGSHHLPPYGILCD